LVVGLDGDRRAWLLEEFYRRRSPDEERIPAIVELTRKHGVAVWYGDSEDPGAIDSLNRALLDAGLTCRCLPVVKGPGSVRAGIQTVTGLLAARGDGTRGLYVDPGCVNTISEFGSYQYASETAKRNPAEDPIKQRDHAMDAARYALHSELGMSARTDAYL